jgi:C-terminal processing protease CtpA/Prc
MKKPGDRIIRIDDFAVKGAALSAVQRALSGKPGDTRKLTIERDGLQITIEAPVVRVL